MGSFFLPCSFLVILSTWWKVHHSGCTIKSPSFSFLYYTPYLDSRISPRDVPTLGLKAGEEETEQEIRGGRVPTEEGWQGQLSLRNSGFLTRQDNTPLGHGAASPILRNCQRWLLLLRKIRFQGLRRYVSPQWSTNASKQIRWESLICASKSQWAVLITALEGMASAGKTLKTGATPSLPLKILDLFPARRSSGSFEHLEETESSFEEDSETNLLIKGKSNFSATRLSVSIKERRWQAHSGEGALLLSQSQPEDGHFPGDQRAWAPRSGDWLQVPSVSVPTFNLCHCQREKVLFANKVLKYTCFDNGRAKFKSQLHHYNLWKVGKVEMLRMLPDIYWMLNKPLLWWYDFK